MALEVYYDKLAIFSHTAVQLWIMDPDFTKNQYVQTLRQAGTTAWRSVLQYGSGDVMYLSHSGIRSLRARNSSLAAAVSDIGSPLDPLLQDLFRAMGRGLDERHDRDAAAGDGPVLDHHGRLESHSDLAADVQDLRAVGLSRPEDHGLVGVRRRLRHHRGVPCTKTVSSSATTTTSIYAYGGISDVGPVYDDCPVELIFPFHAGEQVATFKTFTGLDATCAGVPWQVSTAFNVEDSDVEEYVGEFDGATFAQGRFAIHGHSTHMSLRLRSQRDRAADLSNMVVHYQTAETG